MVLRSEASTHTHHTTLTHKYTQLHTNTHTHTHTSNALISFSGLGDITINININNAKNSFFPSLSFFHQCFFAIFFPPHTRSCYRSGLYNREKKVIFVDKRKLFTINREKREIFVLIRTFSPKSTNSSCHGFFTNVHY